MTTTTRMREAVSMAMGLRRMGGGGGGGGGGVQNLLRDSTALARPMPHIRPPLAALASTSARNPGKAKAASVFRDENIRAGRVRLVSPETNEILPGPFDTRQLLASIDRKRFTLQQVSPGKQRFPDNGGEGRGAKEKVGTPPSSTTTLTLDDLPIVKLIDKKQLYDRERSARQQRQASGVSTSKSAGSMHKDVTFTWNSTLHDIHHKLQPIRANMAKRGPGASCRVLIESKKKSVFIRDEDKDAMLVEVERYLCDWKDVQHEIEASTAAAEVEEEKEEEKEKDGESDEVEVASKKPSELPYFARRRGEIERHSLGRVAILRFEVARR